MSKLRHPYIVTYYGCAMDLEKMQISIVMELLPQSLSDLIKKDCVRLPLFLKINRGIANGLLYLHRVANVIHRDIKPSNILLTESYEPRILDFGISKPNTDLATMTEIGTPEYLAPEILLSKHADAKVDLYSFALVMYSMWTGKKPYSSIPGVEGLGGVAIAVKVATEKLRPKLPENMPKELANLIERCWAPEAVDRPEIEEVVEILNKMKEEGQDIVNK